MRLIPLIGAAILLCLHLSPAFPATDQATRFKIESSGIILVQNSGCDECKSRWQQCRTSCNVPNQTGLSFNECLVVCDTAGQACVQRFCR